MGLLLDIPRYIFFGFRHTRLDGVDFIDTAVFVFTLPSGVSPAKRTRSFLLPFGGMSSWNVPSSFHGVDGTSIFARMPGGYSSAQIGAIQFLYMKRSIQLFLLLPRIPSPVHCHFFLLLFLQHRTPQLFIMLSLRIQFPLSAVRIPHTDG